MISPHPDHDPLHTLIQWAIARIPIRAVLLTSTRAVPNGRVDALSDYDVILIVDDIQPFVADHGWLNDFGEVLVGYWDPIHRSPDFDFDQCGNVIQYVSGLKIDFTLWPVALFQQIVAAPVLPAELDAGYLVLLDKDDLTTLMQPPSFLAYVPKPLTNMIYQTLINDFLSGAPYVAKCLWRDEFLPAKWCLDSDMKHVYLRQMLEWRMAIEQHWSIPTGSLGKGLKKHLPTQIWAALEQTYAGAQPAENWAALEHTLALFRQVALEVGMQLGYSYPEELHQRVCGYVEQIKQMNPPVATTE
jgi:aminoglycoside 6-adenylyltransferase